MPRCEQCRSRIRGKNHEDGIHHGGGVIPIGSKKMAEQNRWLAENPASGGRQQSKKVKKSVSK